MKGFISIFMQIKRNGGNLHTHLRCQKKYRKRTGSYDRRGKIPNAVSIEKRPEETEKRERLGDWEGDTIVGNKHKGAILTLVDRKSGYTLIGQLNKREAPTSGRHGSCFTQFSTACGNTHSR